MPRIARLVVPHIPHHVTQRGNRRQQVFFSDDDYALYKALLRDWCAKAGTKIWAWCLMPNHVHLVLVPTHEDGLRAALGEAHRRYTRFINQRESWRGHLWQERFASFPMDEAHVQAAMRYVELNPVRARLVTSPEQWRWSSATAHLSGRPDGLTDLTACRARVDDWKAFLAVGLDATAHAALQASERTGRALGSPAFKADLAAATGRDLTVRKRGRTAQDPWR
jgi:putative transposase